MVRPATKVQVGAARSFHVTRKIIYSKYIARVKFQEREGEGSCWTQGHATGLAREHRQEVTIRAINIVTEIDICCPPIFLYRFILMRLTVAMEDGTDDTRRAQVSFGIDINTSGNESFPSSLNFSISFFTILGVTPKAVEMWVQEW